MTPCIETTQGRHRQGYGQAIWKKSEGGNGKTWKAHRRAWVEANGPIPDGLCVLHKCDNPPCINVEHLFLGTQLDNIADRHAKGRTSRNTGNKGETNSQAKLTEQQVRDIRNQYAEGDQLRTIARRYGVHDATIKLIVQRKNWAHVE